MNGAVMTLARYYARQTIKKELLSQGLKLSHIEASEITRAANRYIDDHPEIITFATERYRSLICKRATATTEKAKAVQQLRHSHSNGSADR